METEIPAVPAEETPEVTVETPETPEAEELTPEQIADLQKKADVSSQNFERAKKAEAELKEAREKLKVAVPSDTKAPSLADLHAMRDVHEDDIERVEKYARSEGLSIKEALKSDELKAILAVREEKRTTAQAANITGVRRGPTKMSDETLVSNASNGKLPDDDEGIERLIAAKSRRK